MKASHDQSPFPPTLPTLPMSQPSRSIVRSSSFFLHPHPHTATPISTPTSPPSPSTADLTGMGKDRIKHGFTELLEQLLSALWEKKRSKNGPPPRKSLYSHLLWPVLLRTSVRVFFTLSPFHPTPSSPCAQPLCPLYAAFKHVVCWEDERIFFEANSSTFQNATTPPPPPSPYFFFPLLLSPLDLWMGFHSDGRITHDASHGVPFGRPKVGNQGPTHAYTRTNFSQPPCRTNESLFVYPVLDFFSRPFPPSEKNKRHSLPPPIPTD